MVLTCTFAPRRTAVPGTYVRLNAPEKREVNGSTPFPVTDRSAGQRQDIR
jgi:hypothetical protein